MAEFTRLHELFAQILLDIGLSEEQCVALMTILQTPEQMDQMVDYIEKHEMATMSEVLEEAVRIRE